MIARFLLLTSLLAALPVFAEDVRPPARFGGPDEVNNQIEENAFEAALGWGTEAGERWDAWKADLQKEHGFGFGMDYTSVYSDASETLPGGDDSAGAGMYRLYGSWDLVGRGTANLGTLIGKVEHRHAYGDPAPSPLWAATELGYLGLVNAPFNDDGVRVTNFYWRQRLNDGRTSVSAGFLDVTDFIDLHGLISPWLHFTNFAFITGSSTMDLPNDAAFGIGAATMLTDNFYVLGGIVDANGDPEDFWKSVDNSFDEKEFFSTVEFGWTSDRSTFFLDNYHVTFWHKDERDELNKPSGWGVNVSFARFLTETWMPFFRAGWSDDGDSLLERSISTGIGYRLSNKTDLIGWGVNWGQPNPNQGVGDDDQYATELFYRLQVGKRIQLTADVQYIRDPAANPFEDSIWILGARGKVAF
jgi:porin